MHEYLYMEISTQSNNAVPVLPSRAVHVKRKKQFQQENCSSKGSAAGTKC